MSRKGLLSALWWGQGAVGTAKPLCPHCNPCCSAGLGCSSLSWIFLSVPFAVQDWGEVCQKQHGGDLALSLVVPFHAFKPLQCRASVSPQPGAWGSPAVVPVVWDGWDGYH